MSDEKFDPMREIAQLGQSLGRAVEKGLQSVASSNSPIKLDVYEVNDVLTVRTSAIDGIVPDSVEVNIEEGTLILSLETRPEPTPATASYLVQERRFGAFSRTITLPFAVKASEARAKLKDGVLTVTLPIDRPTETNT